MHPPRQRSPLYSSQAAPAPSPEPPPAWCPAGTAPSASWQPPPARGKAGEQPLVGRQQRAKMQSVCNCAIHLEGGLLTCCRQPSVKALPRLPCASTLPAPAHSALPQPGPSATPRAAAAVSPGRRTEARGSSSSSNSWRHPPGGAAATACGTQGPAPRGQRQQCRRAPPCAPPRNQTSATPCPRRLRQGPAQTGRRASGGTGRYAPPSRVGGQLPAATPRRRGQTGWGIMKPGLPQRACGARAAPPRPTQLAAGV